MLYEKVRFRFSGSFEDETKCSLSSRPQQAHRFALYGLAATAYEVGVAGFASYSSRSC